MLDSRYIKDTKKEVFKMELKGLLKPKALFIIENAIEKFNKPIIKRNNENFYQIS